MALMKLEVAWSYMLRVARWHTMAALAGLLSFIFDKRLPLGSTSSLVVLLSIP